MIWASGGLSVVAVLLGSGGEFYRNRVTPAAIAKLNQMRQAAEAHVPEVGKDFVRRISEGAHNIDTQMEAGKSIVRKLSRVPQPHVPEVRKDFVRNNSEGAHNMDIQMEAGKSMVRNFSHAPQPHTTPHQIEEVTAI
jgi:hypothetical protein